MQGWNGRVEGLRPVLERELEGRPVLASLQMESFSAPRLFGHQMFPLGCVKP